MPNFIHFSQKKKRFRSLSNSRNDIEEVIKFSMPNDIFFHHHGNASLHT